MDLTKYLVKPTTLAQRVILTIWILITSSFFLVIYDILSDKGATADHDIGKYILGFFFLSLVLGLIYKVWGNKKS